MVRCHVLSGHLSLREVGASPLWPQGALSLFGGQPSPAATLTCVLLGGRRCIRPCFSEPSFPSELFLSGGRAGSRTRHVPGLRPSHTLLVLARDLSGGAGCAPSLGNAQTLLRVRRRRHCGGRSREHTSLPPRSRAPVSAWARLLGVPCSRVLPLGQPGLGSGPFLLVPALEDRATAESACGSPTVDLRGQRPRRGTGAGGGACIF